MYAKHRTSSGHTCAIRSSVIVQAKGRPAVRSWNWCGQSSISPQQSFPIKKKKRICDSSLLSFPWNWEKYRPSPPYIWFLLFLIKKFLVFKALVGLCPWSSWVLWKVLDGGYLTQGLFWLATSGLSYNLPGLGFSAGRRGCRSPVLKLTVRTNLFIWQLSRDALRVTGGLQGSTCAREQHHLRIGWPLVFLYF